MIQLPEGFNAAALFTEFFRLAAPFAGIGCLIACGFLINRLMKKMP